MELPGSTFFFTFCFIVGVYKLQSATAHRASLFRDDTLIILKRQQEIWRSRAPDRYFMTVAWICGSCVEHERGPFILEIQNGGVRCTRATDGTEVTKFHFFTMNGWFELLISLAEAGEHFTGLEFDPVEGYPVFAATKSYGAYVELLLGDTISDHSGLNGR